MRSTYHTAGIACVIRLDRGFLMGTIYKQRILLDFSKRILVGNDEYAQLLLTKKIKLKK